MSAERTGADLAQMRLDFGLTQKELAALLGVSVQALRIWEVRRQLKEGLYEQALEACRQHQAERTKKYE